MNRILRLSTTSLLALSMLVGPTHGQQASAPVADDVVINMRGADIKDVADQVARITGRTLVLDPNVTGQVNVVSSEPLSRNGVWELFLSVLRTSGFAAVRSGNVWRIVPQAAVVQSGSSEVGRATSNQQIVTRMIRLRNIPSDQAARALRPLVASFGSIEAITDPNAVVVTDYAENVAQVQALARSLDSGGGGGFDSVALQYASAVDVAESISGLLGEDVGAARVSADARSNTLLIRGDAAEIAQARSLARSLDTPGGATPITRVIRLSNGDAESVSEIIRGLLGGEPAATNPVARSLRSRNTSGLASLSGANQAAALGAASAAGEGALAQIASNAGSDRAESPRAQGFNLDGTSVQPSPELNAIVVRGAPATVTMLEDLIRELDVRRPQVMIEAAIVEITGELGEHLGVQIAVGGAVPDTGVVGGSNFSNAGTALSAVLAGLGVPQAAALGEGLSLAAGRRGEFGVLLQALNNTSSANLLSTPQVTVLDNEEAEIIVAQNVPFVTGSFTTDGNSSNNPFQTISREDVGLILRVIPRVNDGDVVKLEVSQEVSSLVDTTVTGAADLITNRRSVQTTVLADDGETIVLGGLVTDDRQATDSRVPGLSNLPVVGGLFRSRRDTQTRRTLFIFLKPTILRDRGSIARAAQERYEVLRQAEPAPVDPARQPSIDDQTRRLPPTVDDIY